MPHQEFFDRAYGPRGAKTHLPIKEGTMVSEPIPVQGDAITGLIVPQDFDGTMLTFEVSHDGLTFYPLYKLDGSRVIAYVTSGSAVTFDPVLMYGWRSLRLKSDTAASVSYDITVLTKSL